MSVSRFLWGSLNGSLGHVGFSIGCRVWVTLGGHFSLFLRDRRWVSAYAFGVSGVEGLVLIRIVYYRGLNNYQYYIGGFLIFSTVCWAPKPYSNYEGTFFRD